MVIVAGGGQLDEFWGGPWGHPFALWRWSRISARVGARFVVLSVGTGNLTRPRGRRFIKRALECASYRSFRDVGSRDLLADLEFTRTDPIVPDLAYGCPTPELGEVTLAPRDRLRVAASPIAYCDPRVWPERDAERYDRHVRGFAALVARLVSVGHDVVMFHSDSPDQQTVRDVLEALEGRMGSAARRHVTALPNLSVERLFVELSACDLVVASRLHGLLLSHVIERPTLAISYERKVEQLMRDMGMEDYCIPIDSLSDEHAWQQFLLLKENRESIAANIRESVQESRRRLEEQFDHVFGTRITNHSGE